MLAVIAGMLLNATAHADTLILPTGDDLPVEDAVAIAQKEALKLLDLSDTQVGALEHSANLVLFESKEPTRAWVVSFYGDELPPPACTVTIASPTGEVKHSSTENSWLLKKAMEAEKGLSYFWSLEEQALFDTLYKKPSSPDHAILPGKADLPQEEALRIAKRTIMDQYGLTADQIDAYQPTYSFWIGLLEANDAKPDDKIWAVSFRPREAEPNGDYANAYQVNISASDGTVYLVYADQDRTS
jgi:hypothetical protein